MLEFLDRWCWNILVQESVHFLANVYSFVFFLFQKLSQPEQQYYADDVPMVLREVPDWPSVTMKPVIGQVGGIAVDSVDNLVVFHRASRRWEST